MAGVGGIVTSFHCLRASPSTHLCCSRKNPRSGSPRSDDGGTFCVALSHKGHLFRAVATWWRQEGGVMCIYRVDNGESQ
jgi:hypothetical protein